MGSAGKNNKKILILIEDRSFVFDNQVKRETARWTHFMALFTKNLSYVINRQFFFTHDDGSFPDPILFLGSMRPFGRLKEELSMRILSEFMDQYAEASL